MKKVNQLFWSYLFLFGIAGAVVALDQWTKYLVRINLELGEEWYPLPDLVPFLRVVHWENTGAAFGLLPQGGVVFSVIAVLVALAIVLYWPRIPTNQVWLRLALALQLAGALGNLTSRLTIGIVTDWIAVGKFPVFNVADASISVGVTILIIVTWWDERRRGKQENEDETTVEAELDERSPEVDPTV